jgi:hypothetical protein
MVEKTGRQTMTKKFSLLLAAIAVLAFAVPGMASAHAVTSKANVLAPVGTEITGTGSDVTLTSNLLGAITCEKLTLKGKITKNDGSTVEGSGGAEKPPTVGCKNGTNPVTVTSVTVTKLFAGTVGGVSKTYATFDATVDIEKPGETLECTFTGTEVPFTYTSGGNSIVFTEAAGIKGAPAACGTAKLDGTFLIEIGSTAVILD